MGLNDALNRRKGSEDNVVTLPVKATAAPEPTPVAGESDLSRPLRESLPGEVGTQVEKAYPDVPYDIDTLRQMLTRLGNGVAYLQANLDNEQGYAQLGFFTDLLNATDSMIRAHMAHAILNKD